MGASQFESIAFHSLQEEDKLRADFNHLLSSHIMTEQSTNYDDVKQYKLDAEREKALVSSAGECVFILGKQGWSSYWRDHGLCPS